LGALSALCAGCGKSQRELWIFHADALNLPFGAIAKAFQEEHPDVRVQRESSGSNLAARKITDLGRPCDILAVADYRIIDRLLIPEHASWQIYFARNEIVLAHTGMSKLADQINAQNWFEILLKKEIAYGHSDPSLDPCGYWTLLTWKLAADHHKDRFSGDLYQALHDGCDPRNIRADANGLLPLLEAVGGLDYAFLYRSVAEQHHLQYVQLPDEINLGNPALEAQYTKARVEVKDRKGTTLVRTGAPIVFGLTILEDARAPEVASKFVQFVLSEKGRKILRKHSQPLVVPPLFKGRGLPAELEPLVKAAE